MNQAEAIKRLCALVDDVGLKVFNNKHPHDCICGTNPFVVDPVVGDTVIAFIEAAVNAFIEKAEAEERKRKEEKQARLVKVLHNIAMMDCPHWIEGVGDCGQCAVCIANMAIGE